MVKKYIYLAILFASVIFTGCTDYISIEWEEDTALFEYEADGFEVHFTNTSLIEGDLLWTFGDGSQSTEENPVHIYDEKGNYNVILKVTDSKGNSHEVFTKIFITKGSDIELDDDTVEDWAHIESAFHADPALSGVVEDFKYDYDANYIYFYFKLHTEYTDFNILNMVIDYDLEDDYGYSNNKWPELKGGGILLENGNGTNHDEIWLDWAEYDENVDDWPWTYHGNDNDEQVMGSYLVDHDHGIVEYEFAVSRDKIKLLKGKDVLSVAGWISDPDWSEIGWFPNPASVAEPNAGGVIIDMR